MVDQLPEFQGPKYRGSFQRGDFADFHQRFSLVPRRMRGKIPQKTPDTGLTSIRVARTRKRLPRPAPPTKSVIYAVLGLPPPGGIPSISPAG